MALVNSAFTVNVTPGAMPPIVHVSEYDTGRTYTVTINGQNGSAFNIPTGTTATVEGTLNGVIGFTTGATISGSTVSFALTKSMTAKSGKAWCKIKLTLNDEPIQTCAFVLAVDRAGVEAEAVIGAPGFQEQINEGIAEYFDNDPPFFELPSGGQSGQALLSDGSGGAYWGQAQSGGTGLSDDAKAALLACFRNVAWIGSDGQDYYDDLYDALYPPAPPATLLSISAVFNQGGHAVYDTDTLDSLKQYLAVTAHYDNETSQTVTNYTLSGTLTVGTSTITVGYGGKTTTFNVTVTHDEMASYTRYDYIRNTVEATSSQTPGSAFSLGFGQEYTSPEYEHEIDVVLEHVFSTSSPVCGLRNASGTFVNARNIWCNDQNGATGKLAATFSEQDTGFTIGANLNEHYVIKTTVENGNAVIYCNNVLASTHSVVSGFTASGNFMMFGATTAGNVQGIRSTVKVYGYKVKNISTGTLVCDFVPCTDSQGNPGVFDRVRNHFYTHSDPQNYLAVGNDAG